MLPKRLSYKEREEAIRKDEREKWAKRCEQIIKNNYEESFTEHGFVERRRLPELEDLLYDLRHSEP